MAWKAVQPTLGLIMAWAHCQWKMLVEAKDLLHQLEIWEYASQATDRIKHEDLAGPEEAEMSPVSTSCFPGASFEKYMFALL